MSRLQALRARWLEPDKVATLPATLAIGVVGGAIFAALGLPAPWLSGPILATACAALAGAKLGLPRGVREIALIVFGVTIGAAVRPDTLAGLARWPAALIGLAVAVPAIMFGVARYLETVHRFDRTTARLAAMPGALPLTLALAAGTRADVPRMLIVQYFRLAVIGAALPAVLALMGVARPQMTAAATMPVLAGEVVALLAAGVAGDALFTRLGLPAPALFGSMVAGAALTGSGLVTTAMPMALLVPGYVVLGAMNGANFTGMSMADVRQTLAAATGAMAVGSGIGLAVAVPVAALLGMPVAQVWLAYAPGGVETMAVIALAFGFDAAFVGLHHIARFLGLSLIAPYWLREEKADAA